MNQTVPMAPAPSHFQYRHPFPSQSTNDQYRGVYYAGGMTARLARTLLLQHKRQVDHAERTFAAATGSILVQDRDMQKRNAQTVSVKERFSHLLKCNEQGLSETAWPHYAALHQSGALSSFDYSRVMLSLSAPSLQMKTLQTVANFDVARVPKFIGEMSGTARTQAALTVFDQHAAVRGRPTALHYNALMETFLSGGYDAVKKVSGTLYDSMGANKVAPNHRTYALVLRSLAILGLVSEVQGVLRFLRTHCGDAVNADMYDSLLIAHRQQRSYDGCDAVWREMCDAGGRIRPTVQTAEQYLRSIIDRSYAAASPDMKKFGELHSVEKKRIPLVLTEMERLGIPRSHLSTPVMNEVDDALRKYVIPKRNFYEWGRAVKQFEYVNFRRNHGLLVDMRELTPSVINAPMLWPYGTRDGGLAPYSSTEAPAWISEKPAWQRSGVDHVLNPPTIAEHMHDTKSGDKFYLQPQPLHARSAAFMSESPQTRYDGLYGTQNPNIPQVGIRKFMLSGEYAGKEDVIAQDTRIMKQSLSNARRVRLNMERHRTHRGGSEQ